MKMSEFRSELKRCGTEALKSTLSGISTLKLKEIRSTSFGGGSDTSFVAYVDVLGRSYVLACEVRSAVQPTVLHVLLEQLRAGAQEVAPDATPVLIAPYLTPEAQALCKQNSTGFLDLVGNARIELGEIFIGRRTTAREKSDQPLVFSAPVEDALSAPRIPIETVEMPRSARRKSRGADTAALVAEA